MEFEKQKRTTSAYRDNWQRVFERPQVITLLEAIAKMEGFGANPHNIPTRNNNPGDIVAGTFTKSHGSTGADGRFAVFPTAEAGFSALRALLTKHYAGMSLKDAINKYAPPVENNTTNYVDVVCKLTGLTPETVLNEENIG